MLVNLAHKRLLKAMSTLVMMVMSPSSAFPMDPVHHKEVSPSHPSKNSVDSSNQHLHETFGNLSPILSPPPQYHYDYGFNSDFEHYLDPSVDSTQYLNLQHPFASSSSGPHNNFHLDDLHSLAPDGFERHQMPRDETHHQDIYHGNHGTESTAWNSVQSFHPDQPQASLAIENHNVSQNDHFHLLQDNDRLQLGTVNYQMYPDYHPLSISTMNTDHVQPALQQTLPVSDGHDFQELDYPSLPMYNTDWHPGPNQDELHSHVMNSGKYTPEDAWQNGASFHQLEYPNTVDYNHNYHHPPNELYTSIPNYSHNHGLNNQALNLDQQVLEISSERESGSSSKASRKDLNYKESWCQLYKKYRNKILALVEQESKKSTNVVRKVIGKNGSMDIIQGLLSKDESRIAKAIDDLHFTQKKYTLRKIHLGSHADRVIGEYRNKFGLTVLQAKHELDSGITSKSAALLRNPSTFSLGADMVHKSCASMKDAHWEHTTISTPASSSDAQNTPLPGVQKSRRTKKKEPSWVNSFPLSVQYLSRIIADYRGGKVDTICRLLPKKGNPSIGHRLASGEEHLIREAIEELDLPPLREEPRRKKLLGSKVNEVTHKYMEHYGIDINKACIKLNRGLTPEIAQLLLDSSTFKQGAEKLKYNKYRNKKDDFSPEVRNYVARFGTRISRS